MTFCLALNIIAALKLTFFFVVVSQDLPSFTQNVHRLTNDLRCYRFANVSRANLYQS